MHELEKSQYAEDCKLSSTPWTWWESRLNKPGKGWIPFLHRAPEWRETHEYRRIGSQPARATPAATPEYQPRTVPAIQQVVKAVVKQQPLVHPPRIGAMCTVSGVPYQWFGTQTDLNLLRAGQVFAA